jgi:glycerol kinase
MTAYLLAIDQGTTSTRSILFRADLSIAATAQQEFPQHYPASGWVEHDAEDVWRSVAETMRAAMAKADARAKDIAAIGISSQRETTLVWERASGRPIHRAIVWQDRRTAPLCASLRQQGHEAAFAKRTGLLLDPYFSGTKIAWMLDHVEGARERAARGELAFGTVDAFLLWRLTGGKLHATDATNASRTLLYDIHDGAWSEPLCELLGVPPAMLPEVRDCAGAFGVTEPAILDGAVAICGVAGDQQAATVGQACFAPGMMKATYGTGCFALLNTGAAPVPSRHRLLTTIAYQLGGKRTYALEGAIFVAGAAVQWLRSGLGIIERADESGALADAADPNQDVILVPAFVGLGAPYWAAEARGALFGLTRATGPKELARAALEAVCYQSRDLLEAMRGDWGAEADTILRVDGGMVASDWTMQRLADLLGVPVDRPAILETTALGAAYLAGLGAGLCPGLDEFGKQWRLERRFSPAMSAAERERKYASWKDAVGRLLHDDKPGTPTL